MQYDTAGRIDSAQNDTQKNPNNSMAQAGSNDEKSEGRKSRWNVPLGLCR